MTYQSPPEPNVGPARSALGPGRKRTAYAHRPTLVAIIVVLAVVVGIVLKTTTRHHRTATNPPDQTSGQNLEPSAVE